MADENADFPEEPPRRARYNTMAFFIDALQKSNQQAIETVAAQSSANSRRMWLVMVLVICVLAAVIGVTASLELPGDVAIGASPEGE